LASLFGFEQQFDEGGPVILPLEFPRALFDAEKLFELIGDD